MFKVGDRVKVKDLRGIPAWPAPGIADQMIELRGTTGEVVISDFTTHHKVWFECEGNWYYFKPEWLDKILIEV